MAVRVLVLAACFLLIWAPAAMADVVVPSDDVTSRVVVRASATSQSDDLGSLRPGENAELLGSVPHWYRVRLATGVEGFVSKRWTRVLPSAPTPAVSFTIDVIDVGTGLSVLVRGSDFTLIYDGGSNDDLARGDHNRVLAYLKEVASDLNTIDHMVLSHPHRDHVELLPDLFDEYAVRHVWNSGRTHPICGYRMFLRAVRNEPSVQYHTPTQGFGTSTVTLPPARCYSEDIDDPEVIQLTHSSRIDQHAIQLGQNAFMTILHADGAQHSSPNENSLVVRLDLGDTRVLLMGDAEAGGRALPSAAPSAHSIEGTLLTCCTSDLSARILVVGHHGSMTSSRGAFLDAVGASTFVVSSGPFPYGKVVLPDEQVIAELMSRGEVFRTDLDDVACRTNTSKIGRDADNEAGGCDNVRVTIPAIGAPEVDYWRGAE